METVSQKQWTQPRYRAVGATSMVDETLFGNTKDSRRPSGGTMNGSRKIVKGPIAPSAVIISQNELERIKNEAVIKSEAELQADRERAELLREEREKKSKERKDRMRELEKRAASLAKKSDMEIAEATRKQTIREMAEKQVDDNSDVVKLLNSMAQRAVAFTIRDQQLEEKKRIEQIEKELERREDIKMEIDRIKDLHRREEEENYKKTKRFEDRKVINEQIESRQRTRMIQLEAREQENQAMRNLMQRYEEEDRNAAERRQRDIEKSRVEVIQANEDAIRRKKEARQREKKEMEDILIYQAMKDAELAKREEEEAAIERTKKERQAKLLAQQERAQNNAGKLDELRARRAAEEKERQERQKEKEEAFKRKAEMKELLEARAKQAQDKIERQKQIKALEQEEIYHQLAHTRKMDEREAEEQRMKSQKINEFKKTLHKQIEEIERVRARQRAEGEGGPNIRVELLREEEKLKVIRDKMVRDLEAQGINPKYLTEMKNVDVGKMLRR
eukprot:gene5597-6015_t